MLASFCLTEPDAGSDVSGHEDHAVKKGDKYVINGSKCFITNGSHANYYTVYAKTDKEAGHRGISAFVVDARPRRRHRGQEGGQARPARLQHRHDLVQRRRDPRREPARRGEQGLQARDDDPRPHAPGRGGHGGRHRARGLRVRLRLLQGARAVRRADRDAPGDPVHDRRHGDQGRGRAPAGLQVGVLLDQGQRNTLVSSHAKRFAADSAMEITVDAVQVYGGYGFIKEYPVEKLMRDAKIMQLYEGTSQIQRLVIAREVLMPRRVEEPRRRRGLGLVAVRGASVEDGADAPAPRSARAAARPRREAVKRERSRRRCRRAARRSSGGRRAARRAQGSGPASAASCAGARCCRCSCCT